MRTAAIYCRVSTEDQKKEGTSLDSQLEACLKKSAEHGCDVPEGNLIREVWSGLTLERPGLTRLRSWAREGGVDAVVVYSTDRMSRDPVHLLLLVEEFDKKGVELVFVTEPLDNSMEGQLLGFVRGWASKLEAAKIKERTMRGSRSRALLGKLPNGRGGRLYGYLYMKGKGEGRGIRVPNEEEAEVVRQIFNWLLEGSSIAAITRRLRLSGHHPPESAATWGRSSVYAILANPAYCGRTYVFRETRVKVEGGGHRTGNRRRTVHRWRPREEWLEIPNATPPVISEDVFHAAQERLQKNKELARRNTRREYLLRGLVKCRACGRNYVGTTHVKKSRGGVYQGSYYRCGARNSLSPVRCGNRRLRADYLDRAVWEQVESILANPDVVMKEVQKRQEDARDVGLLERNLARTKAQLANREKQKARVWKAFEITGDEATFKESISQLKADIEILQREESRLQHEIADNAKFTPEPQAIRQACELVRRNLKGLSLEDKRLAMDALQLKVWIDANTIEVEGSIPLPEVSIASRSAI